MLSTFRTRIALACACVLTLPIMADITQSLQSHPAAESLNAVFLHAGEVKDFQATKLARADYLSLIAGNVDYFSKFQNAKGEIIDPATNAEVQYSTPAYAFASALLVIEGKRNDLRASSIRAFDAALTDLVGGNAADKHSDFYIPLVMHAHRLLKTIATAEQAAKWEKQLRGIDPPKIYRVDLAKMNWNIVSTSGECLRRLDGYVDDSMKEAQWAYIEQSLSGHAERLTRFGMYDDPGAPLAYDAFSRIWLEDLMANKAYDGAMAEKIQNFLDAGGLSSLLLVSPIGEWASGGRSAFHNWNEAEIAAICEYNAVRWHAANRDDIAGAFKRAAHLSLASMKRWQRDSGELYIVKNRAEPDKRLGFERYSNHSQYNLLPMAMLAMAYLNADEAIAERPIPSEVGGYVFDLRETFHKVAAAAGGYYVLIDTAGDPHYNATGLQRVHRTGVPYSPLSDTATAQRDYGAKDDLRQSIVSSLQWQLKSATGEISWRGLGDFKEADPKKPGMSVTDTQLKVEAAEPNRVSFRLIYTLSEKAGATKSVSESYTIEPDGVVESQKLDFPVDAAQFTFPALINDGKANTDVAVRDNIAEVSHAGAKLKIEVLLPANCVLRVDGPVVPCHLGYLRTIVSDMQKTSQGSWRITLEK
jgi:hypothetical protein